MILLKTSSELTSETFWRRCEIIHRENFKLPLKFARTISFLNQGWVEIKVYFKVDFTSSLKNQGWFQNAPETPFITTQRLINKVVTDLEDYEAHKDDVIIYGDTWDKHLRTIREFFKKLSRPSIFPKLCLAKRKSHLRHVVEHGQVKLGNAKVKAIVNLPLPLNKKQLMRFLGMASYYRRFCSNFATVIEPLTQLLSKKEKFIWSGRCEKAFKELKAMLQSAPLWRG